MATPRLHTRSASLDHAEFTQHLAALRVELELPNGFSQAVVAEAQAAVSQTAPTSAAASTDHSAPVPRGAVDPALLVGGVERVDRTDLGLVTLDPLGSRDLDQAFAIEPDGDGHRLFYAIADVAAHVAPGGAIDHESRLRGETLYLPDGRVPLHPADLSEGAASLLPGEARLAVLWTLSIDAGGLITGTDVERAVVRSRAQLDYGAAGAALASGRSGTEPGGVDGASLRQLQLLAALGPRLERAQAAAGAIELPEPEQELVPTTAAGAPVGWTLTWVPRAPMEGWNAELSLATGRAAAALMLKGRCGLLRTLPPAPEDALPRLRLAASALGVDWPGGEPLGPRLARLDPGNPAHLALIDASRTLLRGAGYLPVDGELPAPDDATHAAVAAPYAHVTAPLRRLGDRFATECALAAYRGVPAPDWARSSLPALPELLKAGSRRGGAVGRAVLDLAEALVLQERVGETFAAAVIEVTLKAADVQLEEPPVRARCDGPGLVAGSTAEVMLTVADPATRKVRFSTGSPAAEAAPR